MDNIFRLVRLELSVDVQQNALLKIRDCELKKEKKERYRIRYLT